MRKNFAFTAASVASRLLVSTLLFLLLARLWGPEQFGTFSFVFSVCALLVLMVDFGFPLFLLREIGADPATAPLLISQGVKAKSLLAVGTIVVAAVLAAVVGQETLPFALYILLLLAAILLSYAEFSIAPLRALGRYDLETYLATCGNAIQFLLAGGTAWAGGSPVAVAAAIVVSRMIYVTASWLTLTRIVRILDIRNVPGNFVATVRQLWPYGVDGALTSIWGFIDVVAVRILFGAHIVGLYAAGQKCVQGVVALAPIVGNVVIPSLARKASQRAPDTWRLAARAGYLMVGIGFAFALPLIAIPYWIVGVVFGPEFSELGAWLPWFGAILLVRFTGAAFGVVLSAIGLPKKRVVGQVLALLTYLCAIVTIAMVDLHPRSALVALLIAMTAMGLLYAGQLLAARRSNYLAIPIAEGAKRSLLDRIISAREEKDG